MIIPKEIDCKLDCKRLKDIKLFSTRILFSELVLRANTKWNTNVIKRWIYKANRYYDKVDIGNNTLTWALQPSAIIQYALNWKEYSKI